VRLLSSSETSLLTRVTRRDIPEDTILHGHHRENLKSYTDFLLQLGRVELVPAIGSEEKDLASFSPSQPREKWIKKRTSVKLKVQHRSKTRSSGKK
jgi:hypothetical protein